MKYWLIIFFVALGTMLALGPVSGKALAATCDGVEISVDVDCAPGSGGPIYAYLRGIIKFASGLIGLVAVTAIIVSGIQWMAGSGNPAAIKKAQTRLANAVGGLILFILMAAILRFLVPNIFSGGF